MDLIIWQNKCKVPLLETFIFTHWWTEDCWRVSASHSHFSARQVLKMTSVEETSPTVSKKVDMCVYCTDESMESSTETWRDLTNLRRARLTTRGFCSRTEAWRTLQDREKAWLSYYGKNKSYSKIETANMFIYVHFYSPDS